MFDDYCSRSRFVYCTVKKIITGEKSHQEETNLCKDATSRQHDWCNKWSNNPQQKQEAPDRIHVNRVKLRIQILFVLILTETDTDTEKDQEWLVYDCMEVFILHREIDRVGYCRNFTGLCRYRSRSLLVWIHPNIDESRLQFIFCTDSRLVKLYHCILEETRYCAFCNWNAFKLSISSVSHVSW